MARRSISSSVAAAAYYAVAVLILFVSAGVSPAAACGGHPCPIPDGKCPVNAVKLGVCADVLDGLIHAVVGGPPKEPCCSLISGLVDLDAAVCVCLAFNANVLGVNLDVAVDLSLLVNYTAAAVCPPDSNAPSSSISAALICCWCIACN